MNELNSVSDKGLIPCAAHIKSVANDPNIVLSKRESEVLRNIAWGPQYKEVADFLGISFHTVDKHVRSIKIKTGLNKIGELSAYFFYKSDKHTITLRLFILPTTADLSHSPNQLTRVRRPRRARTEVRCSLRTRAGKSSCY